MTAPALSEAAWQQVVVELATLYRWTVLHVGDARREVVDPGGARRLVGDAQAAGLPDLLLIRERVLWVELKSSSGRLRPAQKRVLEALRHAEQRVFVWRPENLDAVKVELAWRDSDGFAGARNVAVKGERL